MNFSFRSLSVTALGLSSLAFAAGCEVSKCKTDDGRDATCAESMERYTDGDGSADVTMEQPYEAGMDLVVDNIKGSIYVREGTEGVVQVTAQPFTHRGHSKNAEAGEDLGSGWSHDISTGGNVISVVTDQVGGWDEVGATLTVYLPPEFDGALRLITRGAGVISESDIDVSDGGSGSTVMGAWSVELDSRSLGYCNLNGLPTVVKTVANCKGEIEITNVSDDVTAHSDGVISFDEIAVRVSFAEISSAATGGDISSTDGPIELNLPAAGNFQLGASASGTINIAAAPEGCEASDDSVSCGTDGANYIVTAGSDDPGDVNIDFH